MKNMFIAEATIQKQKMKGNCYGITISLVSSAGYCAKQSHNRMIDSHLA